MKPEPCRFCGEFHVLPHGGFVFCIGTDHFAHAPPWCFPSEPMGDEERGELRAFIIAKHGGQVGYNAWCDTRGIAPGKR